MKKSLLLSIFSLCCVVFVSAQPITILSTDLQKINDQFVIHAHETGLPSEGNAGAAQTYDFSNMGVGQVGNIDIVDPATTAHSSSFPTSNIALTGNGTDFTYYTVTTSQATVDGFAQFIADPAVNAFKKVPYSDPLIAGKFPLNYQDTWTDDSKFQFQFKNQASGQGNGLDIRVTRTSTTTYTVDGYGDIITPDGTFECLRIKTVETYSQLVEREKTCFLCNGWTTSDIPGPNPETGTLVTYRWQVKECGLPIAELNYDENGVAKSFSYTEATPPAAPVSDFTFVDNTLGDFDFTDQSQNKPTSWSWDFGDGNTSTDPNPNHVYPGDGDYDVCLTTTNNIGTNTVCKTVTVTGLGPIIPIAGFASVDSGAGKVNFTDMSTNGPTFRFWDFGDGNTSTEADPSHTYDEDGTYTVCLIVNNGAGSDSTCQTVTVSGVVKLPLADFDATSYTITEGQSVDFTDLSTNNPTTHLWTFTGATTTTSTNQNPVGISYPTAGCYEVSLIAGNSAGNASEYKSCFIQVNRVSVGINDASFGNYFSIYPNPTQGKVTVNGLESLSLPIEVYDLIGKQLLNVVSVNSNNAIIDLTDYPSGIYYVRVVDTANHISTLKLIKE